MRDHLHAVVFRHVLAHGPITKVALAAALGRDLASLERTLAPLLGAGIIGVKGHEPDGEPLYAALTS